MVIKLLVLFESEFIPRIFNFIISLIAVKNSLENFHLKNETESFIIKTEVSKASYR